MDKRDCMFGNERSPSDVSHRQRDPQSVLRRVAPCPWGTTFLFVANALHRDIQIPPNRGLSSFRQSCSNFGRDLSTPAWLRARWQQPGAKARMYSLTYVSSATRPFTEAQLIATLETSVKNNARDLVTGMLLYKDGNFMQVLEGVEDAVLRTHERISRDPRHMGLITLLQGPVERRQFPTWSMGFKRLAGPLLDVEGYSEFLETPLTAEAFGAKPDRASVLLRSFKQTMSAVR
jgi:hypothetical protein